MPSRGRAARPRSASKATPKEIYFPDRRALREWLFHHHAQHAAIWLVYDKKIAGTRRLTYDDLVEEALCFGWIDSVAGSVDPVRAKLYFSPRKAGSVWSALNKKRVAKLEALGLIHPAGAAKIEAARRDGSWNALDAVEAMIVPPDLARALRETPKAKANFEAFPPGARKQALYWVASAKKPETRAKRVAEVARCAGKNIRPRG